METEQKYIDQKIMNYVEKAKAECRKRGINECDFAVTESFVIDEIKKDIKDFEQKYRILIGSDSEGRFFLRYRKNRI